MTPLSNRLVVRWEPDTCVGSIHLPQTSLDYHNSDSVKMFQVLAAGHGRTTRKGVFVPNEIKAGDRVIVDARVGNRPEELGDGNYLIRNPDEAVIGVVPA